MIDPPDYLVVRKSDSQFFKGGRAPLRQTLILDPKVSQIQIKVLLVIYNQRDVCSSKRVTNSSADDCASL